MSSTVVAERWRQADFAIDALALAPALLGQHLVRGDVVLRITEVEAYRWPDDTACHARHGRTERNAAMFGPAGHAYVYLCYGIHHLLNIVSDGEGEGAAVLVRACELVEGHEIVGARRGGRTGPAALNGPGRVGAALALDTGWSHHALFEPGGLELRRAPQPARVATGPRIGIDYAEPMHRDAHWRFADADSAWVGHRRLLSFDGAPLSPASSRRRRTRR